MPAAAALAFGLCAAGIGLAQEQPAFTPPASPAQEAAAQEPALPSLWMPEGYRLLTLQERQGLAKTELEEIGRRNMKLLDEMVARMTASERQQAVEKLQSYMASGEPTAVEKQYVTMASMRLLAEAMNEEERKRKQAASQHTAALVLKQEALSVGFPSDQKSVEAEALAVEALLDGKDRDDRKLYLRILKPLRARPWNRQARFVLRRILRNNSYALLEPAFAFVRARRAENPAEGAWDSWEAFLLLSFRGDVEAAKKLFASAVAKNARDLESHIFPLLIAEVEENAAEIARYAARARSAWPSGEDLEKVLFANLDSLPAELRARADKTFAAKYTKKHPTDWEARLVSIARSFFDGALAHVEAETSSLLTLPASVFPEPHRTKALAWNLRSRAGLGRCAEVEARIPALEAAAVALYPPQFDPDSEPKPRSGADVSRLRASSAAAEKKRGRLDLAQGDGFPWEEELREVPPEQRRRILERWRAIPEAERRELLADTRAELESEIALAREILAGGDDTIVAREWSRRELLEWEKSHGIPAGSVQYDIKSRAGWFSIAVRGAAGRCLLQRGNPAAAARVVERCVGGGRNWHGDCVGPYTDAGVSLARMGKTREATEIYKRLLPLAKDSWQLVTEIEKAAPGSIKPHSPAP